MRGREAHVNGELRVVVKVDPSGTVTDVRPLRSFRPFETPCLKAAAEWRFTRRAETAGVEEKVITFRFPIMSWDTLEEEAGVVFEAPTAIEVRARMARPKAVE